MKKILVICCVALSLVACSKKYVIEGQLNASVWGGKDAYLVTDLECEMPTVDTAAIDNDGKFVFEGELDEGDQIAIVFLNDKTNPQAAIEIPIILEKGTIAIDATTEKYTIEGTETNDKLNQYNRTIQDFQEEMLQLQSQFYALAGSGWPDSTDVENIMAQLDSLSTVYYAAQYAFTAENLDNLAGVLTFVQGVKYYNDDQFTFVVENSSEEFKQNALVKPLFDQYEQQRATAVGKPFVDFEMQNLDNEVVRLSDFVGKGKYVVIDFWASWCGPCRRSMPTLKELYTKYADQLDIVGVSLDSEYNDWKNCVESLELPWHHMSDLAGWECKGAQLYGVRAIPHMVLIDADGVIVAKDLDDEKLAQKLEEFFK